MTAYLFLGGPKDGDVMALPGANPPPYVNVMHEPEPLPIWHPDEDVATSMVMPSIVVYRWHTLRLFGHVLTVYALDGLDGSTLDRLAAEYLLSPLAKGLLA